MTSAEIVSSAEGFEHLQQGLVDDDHLVSGVLGDEREFVGEQSGVEVCG